MYIIVGDYYYQFPYVNTIRDLSQGLVLQGTCQLECTDLCITGILTISSQCFYFAIHVLSDCLAKVTPPSQPMREKQIKPIMAWLHPLSQTWCHYICLFGVLTDAVCCSHGCMICLKKLRYVCFGSTTFTCTLDWKSLYFLIIISLFDFVDWNFFSHICCLEFFKKDSRITINYLFVHHLHDMDKLSLFWFLLHEWVVYQNRTAKYIYM